MVQDLVDAISELVAADPAVLADSESIVALHRELARLDAVVTRATASWDARQEWAVGGGRSGASWLAATCRTPTVTAHRRIRLGRALRTLPHTETAWLAGDIDSHHVGLLADQARPATTDALARDEELLVGHARTLPHRHFAKAVAYWRQVNDPDGAERAAEKLHTDRRFTLSQTWRGGWHGDLFLDPVAGAILNTALGQIEQELFAAEWADAKHRLGRPPAITDLAWTAAQRRADALVELATRAMTTPADGRRPVPLFTALVGYETLHGRICELADGTVVTPGTLTPWLDGAMIERVVFDGPSRVIDIGVQRRLFQGATRRAIEIRDKECYHPLCAEPVEHCQADHVVPYTDGGPTTQDNGQLACGFHNRLRTQQPQAP